MKPIILTLSRFPDIFRRLWESIEVHEPDARTVLVTSGQEFLLGDWGCNENLLTTAGEEPFVFARNANRGLWHIHPDRDVLLINDDCCLTMPILDTLQGLCDEHPDIGILSPQIVGGVGSNVQRASESEAQWIESPVRLAFVCVYLPARTRDIVGPLNEIFSGYGGEDNEYCRRVRATGMKLAVTPLVKVVHGYGPNGMSTSFDRVMGRAARDRSMARMLALEQELAKQ